MPKKTTMEFANADVINQLLTNYIVVGDCHIWVGNFYKKRKGYPRISRSSKSKFYPQAHRASYQYHNGEIPNGLFVCHSCDIRACINPKHLWLGTHQENMDDGVKKGIFKASWTLEQRKKRSELSSGKNNPMYGKSGELAPCYGRTGEKHPMYGKNHTQESKNKISNTLLKNKRKNAT